MGVVQTPTASKGSLRHLVLKSSAVPPGATERTKRGQPLIPLKRVHVLQSQETNNTEQYIGVSISPPITAFSGHSTATVGASLKQSLSSMTSCCMGRQRRRPYVLSYPFCRTRYDLIRIGDFISYLTCTSLQDSFKKCHHILILVF